MSRTLAELEKEAILNAVLQSGTVCRAAENLGINRATLYRKMRRYGLKMKVNQILTELKRQETLSL